jgi:hypothetical protein
MKINLKNCTEEELWKYVATHLYGPTEKMIAVALSVPEPPAAAKSLLASSMRFSFSETESAHV